jgi:ABC-2 type transport system ATP-binding protein
MEQLTGGSGYEVELDGEIEEEKLVGLKQISGVKVIEKVGNLGDLNRGIWRFGCELDQEPAPEILAMLLASDLKVYELRRTRASLEDVFLELTTQTQPEKTELFTTTDSQTVEDMETEKNISSELGNEESKNIEDPDSQPKNSTLDREEE